MVEIGYMWIINICAEPQKMDIEGNYIALWLRPLSPVNSNTVIAKLRLRIPIPNYHEYFFTSYKYITMEHKILNGRINMWRIQTLSLIE